MLQIPQGPRRHHRAAPGAAGGRGDLPGEPEKGQAGPERVSDLLPHRRLVRPQPAPDGGL